LTQKQRRHHLDAVPVVHQSRVTGQLFAVSK